MSLWRLLRIISGSHLKQEPLKVALTVIGIALGIAVYSAIRLANVNVLSSFTQSSSLLQGNADFTLVSTGSTVAEELIPKIASIPGVATVSPLSIRHTEALGDKQPIGAVQVIGVDLAGDSLGTLSGSSTNKINSLTLFEKREHVLVSPALNDALDHHALHILRGIDWWEVVPVAVLKRSALSDLYGGKTIVMDIEHFQDIFQDYGHVDQLNIRLKANVVPDSVREQIRNMLPPTVALRSNLERNHQTQQMTAAFRLNLNFLAGMSLFVAALLMYNVISFSVLKRRREIGILLALGASAHQILYLFCLESLVLGLAGAILGLGLGYSLAYQAVGMISKTMSVLYLPVEVQHVALDPAVALQSLFFGPLVALLASAIPFREIFRVTPRETFFYENLEARLLLSLPRLEKVAIVCFLGSIFFARPSLLGVNLYLGFVSPLLLILSSVLVTPSFLRCLVSLCARILPRRYALEGQLALDHVRMTLFRNASAVAALSVSFALFFSLTVLISSFRTTVQKWISYVTRADLYVSSTHPIDGTPGGYLPEELVTFLVSYPDVQNYDWVTTRKIMIADREVKLVGNRFEALGTANRFLFEESMTPEELNTVAMQPNVCFVSEVFANRNRIAIGDSISIPGSLSTMDCQVANIFFDYSSDQGVIRISDKMFAALYGETRMQGVSLYLKESTQTQVIRDAIQQRFPQLQLTVEDHHGLRTKVLRIFDDTFRITYALQFVALLIAALTIVNTMLMLRLERAREFSLFRSIGASISALARMVTIEALFLGASSLIGGLVSGFALSLLLVFVVNKFFFGWSIDYIIPYTTLATTSLALLCLSWISGYVPGVRMAKDISVEELRYE